MSCSCVNILGPVLCSHSSPNPKHYNSFMAIHPWKEEARTRRVPLLAPDSPSTLTSRSIPGVPIPQCRNSHSHPWRLPRVKRGDAEGNLSSEGMILDEQTLQRDLEMAIKEENYARAAKLRDDLRVLHKDSEASVLAANARFYHAFRNGDLAAMHSIWAKGENVYCVHPGAGRISGYDMVMGSWEIVCGADHEFPLQIDLKNVEVYIRGDVGYVTCMEVVKTKGNSWGKQVATNVFERVDGQWFICIHHASHIDM